MPTTVKFFDPTDILSATDWHLQSRNPSTSRNRAQCLKANGDEAKSQLYGAQTSDTLTYKACGTPATIDLSTLHPGVVVSGWHIDRLSIKYNPTDFTEISFVVHKHDACETGRTSHQDIANEFVPSVASLPAGFGIPAALKTLVGISDESVDLSEFTYDLSVQHQDETGGSGAWLAAENRDGEETIQISTVGVPSSAPAITGWDCTANGSGEGNTAAETGSWTFEHHVGRVVPETSSSST